MHGVGRFEMEISKPFGFGCVGLVDYCSLKHLAVTKYLQALPNPTRRDEEKKKRRRTNASSLHGGEFLIPFAAGATRRVFHDQLGRLCRRRCQSL